MAQLLTAKNWTSSRYSCPFLSAADWCEDLGMDANRQVILFAPIAVKPKGRGFDGNGLAAERPRASTALYHLRSLLGECSPMRIEFGLIDTFSKELEPLGIHVQERDHVCEVFNSGVAILKLWIEVDDVRAYLRGRTPQQAGDDGTPRLDSQLHEILHRLAKAVLSSDWAVDDRDGTHEVDWDFSLVDTERYINPDYATETAQDAAEAAAKEKDKAPPSLEVGRTGIQLWTGWQAVQVNSFKKLAAQRPPLDCIADVVVIRCVLWKLMTSCGERAAEALSALEQRRSRNVVDLVRTLRELQIRGARILSGYGSSLWTTDRYLLPIFDSLDVAWNLNAELSRTKELLDAVTVVLATQHNIQLDNRAYKIAGAAFSLAILALLSAISDMFTFSKAPSERDGSVPWALAVPIAVVLITLFLWWLLAPARQHIKDRITSDIKAWWKRTQTPTCTCQETHDPNGRS